MNFQQAVQTCFRKYVEFSGRATRPEYWWFILALCHLGRLAGFIHEFLYYLVVLAFLLPLLAVGARRLHDVGRSAWFLLLGLVPVIGGTWCCSISWSSPASPSRTPTGRRPAPMPAGVAEAAATCRAKKSPAAPAARLFRLAWRRSADCMPMPPMPPMPPMSGMPPPPAPASSFGASATMASVVSISEDTEAAFCSAVRVTLVGSRMPSSSMSP